VACGNQDHGEEQGAESATDTEGTCAGQVVKIGQRNAVRRLRQPSLYCVERGPQAKRIIVPRRRGDDPVPRLLPVDSAAAQQGQIERTLGRGLARLKSKIRIARMPEHGLNQPLAGAGSGAGQRMTIDQLILDQGGAAEELIAECGHGCVDRCDGRLRFAFPEQLDSSHRPLSAKAKPLLQCRN
jgi:hypothetical protein